eukprot:SAG22_NODE_14_length_33165_cov_13.196698_11_plen_68_part_00
MPVDNCGHGRTAGVRWANYKPVLFHLAKFQTQLPHRVRTAAAPRGIDSMMIIAMQATLSPVAAGMAP